MQSQISGKFASENKVPVTFVNPEVYGFMQLDRQAKDFQNQQYVQYANNFLESMH